MTRRERLTAIFQGHVPDRPAVKLWGLHLGQKFMHPAYEPVYRLGIECTDLMGGGGAPFNLHWGAAGATVAKSSEQPTHSPEWIDVITEVSTPAGQLRSIYTRNTHGKPGYEKEHLLKEPEDIKKLLSVPYEPFPFNPESFRASEKNIGDRGITVFGLDHAMYGLERLIGSENFAFWSLSDRELLSETIAIFAQRIRDHAKLALGSGLKVVYGWVGPELCIPPLMSPTDFDEFVGAVDKPLIDMIHEGGGYVWVHCHGKMGPVLERFVAMGVDVLNPIEPPPMGDLTLPEAFARVGTRMGLEGNIESHDLMSATPEHIRGLVEQAVSAGRGHRHILCQSSGYMEWPFPEERMIQNCLTYIREGVRCAEAART
ncbi:MAG: hypothetical protein A3K19_00290 [Lentisphaerae bacterium RIFOXYB12_FULL_65_16]|nr:MAG: hypothetical protein A3K18_34350 [Lentisphaerae bacterium RIFOXYA12_64_32]OGV85354.1 MAG: hypothetical protein A3K19_00290 [Lentisphaerae bacterium RIFOXYB12_FULL_65_16]